MNSEQTGHPAKITATLLPYLHIIALPTPFPVGDVNVFFVTHATPTLIDCGVRTPESRAALDAGLAALGYSVRDIQRVILTHHHADHIGLAGDIAAESGAEILAHPLTVPWLENPQETRHAQREFTNALYRANGVPEDKITLMNHVGRYLESFMTPVQVTRTLEEDETVVLDGQRWHVYHTPGHAGDMICLYQPEERVLLSSDHVLRDVSSNPLIEAPAKPGDPRPKRLLDYLRELARIARLPIDIAYGGHGDAVLDVKALIETRLELHEKRAEKLRALLYQEPKRGWTLYEMGIAMFPKARETDLFLVLSETLGHLDMLEARHMAHYQIRDGITSWFCHGGEKSR